MDLGGSDYFHFQAFYISTNYEVNSVIEKLFPV
jgi:hypothetical protein